MWLRLWLHGGMRSVWRVFLLHLLSRVAIDEMTKVAVTAASEMHHRDAMQTTEQNNNTRGHKEEETQIEYGKKKLFLQKSCIWMRGIVFSWS